MEGPPRNPLSRTGRRRSGETARNSPVLLIPEIRRQPENARCQVRLRPLSAAGGGIPRFCELRRLGSFDRMERFSEPFTGSADTDVDDAMGLCKQFALPGGRCQAQWRCAADLGRRAASTAHFDRDHVPERAFGCPREIRFFEDSGVAGASNPQAVGSRISRRVEKVARPAPVPLGNSTPGTGGEHGTNRFPNLVGHHPRQRAGARGMCRGAAERDLGRRAAGHAPRHRSDACVASRAGDSRAPSRDPRCSPSPSAPG